MEELARVNVGGDKHHLDHVYTTLINLPADLYNQTTEDVEVLANRFGITVEQAFILKLEATKKRPCK